MGVINAHNNIVFESPKNLFAKIKRNLRSYNQAGLLDENDFYDCIMYVLDRIGIGALMEEQAVLDIKNHQCILPENFKTLDIAYTCKVTSTDDHPHMQNGFVFFTDTTFEQVSKDGCKITCPSANCQTKVTVREFIQGIESIHNFDLHTALRIVPFHPNLHQYQISFDNGRLHTGFKEGTVYIKYYAYPIDLDTGLPLIPRVESIQKAIEFYVMYETFLNFYWNDEVPNGIAQKAAEAKNLSDRYLQMAMNESKMPGFQTAIDSIRMKKHSLDVYQQTDFNT